MMITAFGFFIPVYWKAYRELRAANGYKLTKTMLFIFFHILFLAFLNWGARYFNLIPLWLAGLIRCFTFLATMVAFYMIYYVDKGRH